MTKSVLSATFIASIFIFVQTTWLGNGLLGGIIPDLALLVIIWTAYSNRNVEGVVVGLFTGMISDLLSASPLGFYAFIYIIPAYILSFLKKAIHLDRFFIPVLMGFSATLLKGIASMFLEIIFGSHIINAYSFSKKDLWIEAVLNGTLAPLTFFLLGKFKNYLVTKRLSE